VNSETRPDRWWRWLWIGSILALALLCLPSVLDLYRLRSARNDGDLPRALAAAKSLSDGFFGPLFSSWLDRVTREIQAEIVEGNLLSIQRLVPDTEESAFAELELGRLALSQGNAKEAAVHLERYLRSGVGRDANRARMDLSEACREMKKYDDSARLLQEVLNGAPPAEQRMEAAFRLGELFQFYLSRPADALSLYQRALLDTSPGRWRNDILTNLSLLKE